MTTKLGDLASLVRSKNAGPFFVTIDIMFLDPGKYEHVKTSKILQKELFANIYDVDVASVDYFECDNALSFKVTIPRSVPQGGLGESDMYAGQQFDPVSLIEIPN